MEPTLLLPFPFDRLDGHDDDLDSDAIAAMCRSAFGPDTKIEAVRELGGGTLNTTFLVSLADRTVVLRIAPAHSAETPRDRQWLMRRETQLQPFFAALGTLVPRTLAADFTHQLIGRDYLFQNFLPGERWEDVADELAPDDALTLWQEFGAITKTIHATAGERFGGPHPLPEFDSWGEAVIGRFDDVIATMSARALDTAAMTVARDLVYSRRDWLDEVAEPRLLHGDLWLFNLLIDRTAGAPRITAVIDVDRGWWGDPLADWTMFCLGKELPPDAVPLQRFWAGYGGREQSPTTAFRVAVYEAMNLGAVLIWCAEEGHSLDRPTGELADAVQALESLVS